MSAVSFQIAERARKNLTAILRALAEVGQVHAAQRMGVSETKVSRLKGEALEDVSMLLAACGIKCLPDQMECFDPEYVRALKVMAGVGLKAPEKISLDSD